MSCYYKQPRYFDSFHCLAYKCPDTCCRDWNILWTEDEVKKLGDFSAFEEYGKGYYTLKFDGEGRCPFLNGQGLCSIHKEKGEQCLSYVCRSYPRLVTGIGNIFVRTCSAGCIGVTRLLCESENAADILLKRTEEESISARVFSDGESTAYLGLICDVLYRIIAVGGELFSSLDAAGQCADRISRIIADGKAQALPKEISAFTANTVSPDLRSIADKTHKILSEIFGCEVLSGLADPAEGKARFERHFSEAPFALRNILQNMLIEQFSFNYKEEYTVAENYRYFRFSAQALIFLAWVAAEDAENTDEMMIFISRAVKMLTPNTFVFKKVTEMI